MQIQFDKLENKDLISRFENLVSAEKKTTAEVLEYLKEIDSRKLYLELGYTSLFAYLTKSLGYSESAALRRIDGARLLKAVPEIKKDLESGALNLMQVSMVAQGLRQKKKTAPVTSVDKKLLLMKVKSLDSKTTQKVVSESLSLEIKTIEKKRIQKDESVRLEITLTKAQMESLNRVKDLVSHSNPSPSFSDLVDFLACEFLKRKDPLKKEPRATSRTVVKKQANMPNQKRSHIPLKVQRQVHQKFKTCQWVHGSTHQKCGSSFQIQIDHIKPVWQGGGNDIDNLSLLCSIHNKLKYQNELRDSTHQINDQNETHNMS